MYKSKLLFRNTNGSLGKEASAIESVWAFLYGTENKKAGRYRIRITKMSAQELIAMGLAPEETPSDYYGLQATLDRWHESNAWLPLFDWVGDPTAEIEDIEKDLGKQFESFVTGIALDESFGFDLPKPPKPIKLPKSQKPTKQKDLPPEEPSETNNPEESSDDDDDLWL